MEEKRSEDEEKEEGWGKMRCWMRLRKKNGGYARMRKRRGGRRQERLRKRKKGRRMRLRKKREVEGG